jgi:site-specific recombinase XerD
LTDSLVKTETNEVQSHRDLDKAFAEFLRIDVANGDASPDTIRGYLTQVAGWLSWCKSQHVNPAHATTECVKAYRQDLVSAHYKPASIAHRLAVLRRFYQAAVNAGLRPDNPAAGVRPPKEKRAAEDFGYLSEVELTLLLRSVPVDYKEKNLRDRALLALLGLQGLRTIEIERANVVDLELRGDSTALLVHGKGRDRLVYLRPDVLDVLDEYISLRSNVEPDSHGVPLFASVGNYAGGKRISRRGIRKVVDFYLLNAGLKKSGLSNHALRHTAATLGYKHSHDLRAVQDMLGHADPKTTARYARVVDMAKSNPALTVPVKLK